jgi:hypothetical protein
MLQCMHEVKCLGKAAGPCVQNSMAHVEAWAVAFAGGAVTDRDYYSASGCYGY